MFHIFLFDLYVENKNKKESKYVGVKAQQVSCQFPFSFSFSFFFFYLPTLILGWNVQKKYLTSFFLFLFFFIFLTDRP